MEDACRSSSSARASANGSSDTDASSASDGSSAPRGSRTPSAAASLPRATPRLIGCLCWFDESTSDLLASITSFAAAGLTHLVAVDGAYGMFPGAQARSSRDQHVAIKEACDEAGIPGLIYAPKSDVWGSEMTKRAFMFRLAAETLTLTERDWVWVFDADERVEKPTDVKPLLAKTREAAADVRLVEPQLDGTVQEQDLRMLFRALPGLTVAGTHYTYIAGDRVLWGYGQEKSRDLTFLRVHHLTHLRHADRRAAKDVYYGVRDAAGIEPLAPCAYCPRPPAHTVRTGFALGSDLRLRSNRTRVCDKHLRRVQYVNEADLERVLTEVEAVARERGIPTDAARGAVLDAIKPEERLPA
jgi:hypothetical protein